MTRVPPARVVQAADAVRTRLQSLVRRMVPPPIGLLELASGFIATQTVYAAARLGLADVLADGRCPRPTSPPRSDRTPTPLIGCCGRARCSASSPKARMDASG